MEQIFLPSPSVLARSEAERQICHRNWSQGEVYIGILDLFLSLPMTLCVLWTFKGRSILFAQRTFVFSDWLTQKLAALAELRYTATGGPCVFVSNWTVGLFHIIIVHASIAFPHTCSVWARWALPAGWSCPWATGVYSLGWGLLALWTAM